MSVGILGYNNPPSSFFVISAASLSQNEHSPTISPSLRRFRPFSTSLHRRILFSPSYLFPKPQIMAEDELRPAARLRRSSVSSSRASGSSHDSVPAYISAPAPAAPHAAAQQDPGVMPVHLLVQQPGR
ncbi:unnamed protein product, partial [Brassica oleracea]